MQTFEAARKCLKNSLEKSSAIACALNDSGSRLELLNQRCQSLELCSFADIGESLDSVLCSAAAVLKVFDAVHQLENSLSIDPSSDLYAYISDTKKLEEALVLLSDNCRLSLGWLQDIVEFLQDKAIINELYTSSAGKSLKILQELQAMKEGARLDGGLLSAAFEKLEIEFRRLLIANAMLLPLASLESSTGQQVNAPLLPGTVIGKLKAIVERLSANDRLHNCKSIYVEVRSTNARTSLKPLDLSYLEIPTVEFDDTHCMESYIERWGRHLELAVRHLLEVEYRLCSSVFEKIGPEAWIGCFANIAIESGILSFLQFAKRITESKSDPIKLLKLLDIFRVLNDLRLNFNRLFSGKACEEIRNVTKDLIKRVVDGACEIFWELPAQVKLQRPSSPPRDGSVPRLVSFVTDYCNQLLSDAYRPHLTQVLEIHLNWRKEIYQEGIIFTQVYNIVKEIAVNLDTWSKAYEDIPLSYLFMMNNHCHFYNLRGTVVGRMMGDSWLRAHEQYKEYYAALYLRESWGKLLPILNQRDLLSSSGGRLTVTVQDLVKRLDAFNLVFDERYKKQSNWVISDEILREKERKHLA
ncbi:hypothetical protein L6164_004620 [Bauhinia variegata]|uniref:Uncharacterized protein n=1 Tax=Bauhinia variegata TaxID=167791 RepID=A0ACB9Q777_BAUVA|nr:hypothetical protein L6164_004620 [Bauhinia variegata]